jgi:hypothetical protein
MAKGDIQDKIKRGIQPGLKPMGAMKGLSIGPSFDELSGGGNSLGNSAFGHSQGSNKGKHAIGPNKDLMTKYNNGVPNG